ncbi:MAG: hypothetical protein R3B06_04630 [Kofleriaceae bacterium]
MLAATMLRDRLRTFCDPDLGPTFGGFPASRVAARQAWAAAFAAYLNTVEEVVPSPPPGHPALITSGAEAAFFGALALDRDAATTPGLAAADLAGAWRAAVQAIGFGVVTDSGGNVWTASALTNVAPLHAALVPALTAALSSAVTVTPPRTAVAQLGLIADALHAATSGLIVTVAVVNASSAPLPTVVMAVH